MPHDYRLPTGARVRNVQDLDCSNSRARFYLPGNRPSLEHSLMIAWRHFRIPDSTLEYMLKTALCDLARGSTYEKGHILMTEDAVDHEIDEPQTDELQTDGALAPVVLDITLGDARLLYESLVRARDGLRDALKTGNGGEAGYFFGWMDALLTRLGDAAPRAVKNPRPGARAGGGGKPA